MFDPMDHETPAADLELLRNLVIDLEVHAQPFERLLVAVEVGSWAGGSARVIAPHVDRLYCIDHWMGNLTDRLGDIAERLGHKRVFGAFCRNMGDLLFTRVFPCRGPSDLWASVWNQPIDFLFLDADHRYDRVRQDLQLWLPHVRPGGCVAVHDYGGEFEGVTRAVDELLPDAKKGGECLAYYWMKEDDPCRRNTSTSATVT